MKEKYKNWISKFISENKDIYGLCNITTLLMIKEFPELRRIRGHVNLLDDTRTVEHWWCITSEGIVIDPTKTQFMGMIEYEPWDETRQEPLGKCLNCGNYCYDNPHTCCKKCETEFKNSLMG